MTQYINGLLITKALTKKERIGSRVGPYHNWAHTDIEKNMTREG